MSDIADIPLDFRCKLSIGVVTESRWENETGAALTERSAGLWVVGAAGCRSDKEDHP